MMEQLVREATALRHELHRTPEPAFQEHNTRMTLCRFLGISEETTAPYLLVCSKGCGSNPRKIALRADMDAVCGGDGNYGHYCGHDGHSAALAAAYRYLEQNPHEDDIYCLFQPAEETGMGAQACVHALKDVGIEEIYGFHNIPGKPRGRPLLRHGTFACASTGLELRFTGTPAHAAYPEDGRNPALCIADCIRYVSDYLKQPRKGMLLGTVIGTELGSAAYGVSASEGTLRLTLRGELQAEYAAFTNAVLQFAENRAREEWLALTVTEIEPFCATENDPNCVNRLEKAFPELSPMEAPEPFRWSEDFGVFLTCFPGAMWGIGDGEDHPGLHTADYEFPDTILPAAIRAYLLAAGISNMTQGDQKHD